jgi:CubicO group peptidase (beta-lactamase class C family)
MALSLALAIQACGEAATPAAEALPLAAPAPLMQLGPWLQAEAAADRFSGAVIVARGDTVLHRAAYGPADRAKGAPLTPEHRFRLASLSKQFTAAAVLRLQDQGVLGVDDPLCKWVQPCPEAWRPITLHHLLTHQSGVPDLMTRRDWPKLRFQEWTPAELAADSARLPLDFAPGTDVRYSNAAYNLLGSVVEKASGKPFAEQLRLDLLEPLGLREHGLGRRHRAAGHGLRQDGRGPRPTPALGRQGRIRLRRALFHRGRHAGLEPRPARRPRAVGAQLRPDDRRPTRRAIPCAHDGACPSASAMACSAGRRACACCRRSPTNSCSTAAAGPASART